MPLYNFSKLFNLLSTVPFSFNSSVFFVLLFFFLYSFVPIIGDQRLAIQDNVYF